MDEEQSRPGTGVDALAADASGGRTAAEVRAEIERTRADLGETVEALAARTDVKTQARHAVDDAKATVNQRVGDLRGSVSAKRGELTSAAQQAAPDSAGEAGRRVSELARENRPGVFVAGALLFGFLLGRRRAA